MKYKLDITDSYQQFICLDSDIGLAAYFSLLDLSDTDASKINISIDNIEVNMSEKKWFHPIISINKKSIINKGLEVLNIENPDCIYSAIISKSTLTIDNVKCVYISFGNDGKERNNSSDKGFDIGDRFIWLAGQSAEFPNTRFSAMIVFAGNVEFSFRETDIIIQSLDLKQNINHTEAASINEKQELVIAKKKRDINEIKFNNIKSNFLDYDFYRYYFTSDENGNIAIKNHFITID